MDRYLHRVVGLYPSRSEADLARNRLVANGMAPEQIKLLASAPADAGAEAKADSDDVLQDLLRDGAIGTAVGTAAGAGVSIALAAANLTLFIASPVLGALYLIGWGASLGGLVGAVVGAERSTGDVSTLIKDALAHGQVVLAAHARTEAETTLARQVLGPQDKAGAAAQPITKAITLEADGPDGPDGPGSAHRPTGDLAPSTVHHQDDPP